MQVVYTSAGIFCLVAMVLCVLIGMVLIIFSSGAANKANLLLGAHFVFFACTMCIVYLIFTRLILLAPHLYRTGHITWLLSIPLAYLYVRVTVKKQPLTWKDIIHLTPVLIFLLDYAPFLFSSATYKLVQIKADLNNLAYANSFRQGWLFPPNFHVVARLACMIFYWFLQVRLLTSQGRSIKQQNQMWYYWLLIFNALQIMPIIIAMVSLLLNQSYVWATCVPPAACALASAIVLFLYPQILYGTSQGIKKPEPVRQRSVLDDAFVSKTSAMLEKLMQEHKPFLNSNYSLKELAVDLNIPQHQASAFINQVTGKNFNDYLNQQRIIYCLDFLKSGDAERLNIYGIAQQCGFNNRNTFTIAFKKVTGLLPSEYLTIAGNRDDFNSLLRQD